MLTQLKDLALMLMGFSVTITLVIIGIIALVDEYRWYKQKLSRKAAEANKSEVKFQTGSYKKR